MALNPTAIAQTQSKFLSFTIHSSTYHHINTHPLTTDIFIPKNLPPGPHPLIVRLHGGFLITGFSLNVAFFPSWILDLALHHSAILVSPNYVKLPESNGLEILDNLAHFWTWLRSELQPTLTSVAEKGVSVDHDKTLVIGHSAGGYLGIQSALTQPAGSIRAVIAAYAMIDMASPFGSHPFGRETLPVSILDDHIAAMKAGEVITGTPPPGPERLELAIAIVQHDRFPQLMGRDRSLYPLEVVKSARTFPSLFIYHGTEDSSVDVANTKDFVAEVKKILDQDKLMVKLEPGDHGFDSTASLSTPWLKEGLDMVAKHWLR